MKKSEVAMLLAFKHSLEDQNEPTELEVESWHRTIGHLEYGLAMDAATDHYRETPLDDHQRAIKLMPKHIIDRLVEPLRDSSWAGNVTELRIARETAALPPGGDDVA